MDAIKFSCPVHPGEDCLHCGKACRLETDLLTRQRDKLLQDIKWIGQTVHQAHHDGSIEHCRKNICTFVAQLLRK